MAGEPLLEKKVIFEFLEKYHKEMEQANCTLAITTNGTLLTEKLIDNLFKYSFTTLEISVDTFNSGLDERGLKEQLQHIHNMIEYISKKYEDIVDTRLSIASVISESQIDLLKDFTDELVDVYNIRSFALLPLFASADKGLISWKDENLEKFKNICIDLQNKDVEIGFLEGTGRKGTTNCLIGNNKTVVVDSSGDFGGCYFCLNRKDELPNLVLGNMFENKFYHERMKNFIKLVKEQTESEEQCKNCNLAGGLCHQCFAGNFLNTGKIVHPTDMCQKLVKIFLEINNQAQKKKIKNKLREIYNHFVNNKETVDYQLSLMLVLLLYYDLTGIQIEDLNRVKNLVEENQLNRIISMYYAWLENDLKYNHNDTIEEFITHIELQEKYKDKSLFDLVKKRAEIEKIDFNDIVLSDAIENNSLENDALLITIFHVLVLNRYKSEELQWKNRNYN